MAKQSKVGKVDGLGPDDLKRVHSAVRKVWQWSHPVRLVRKRCTGEDGFFRCEAKDCESLGQPVAKIQIDHKHTVGVVGGPDYIQRMFVSSDCLQGLCKKCHAKKTKKERQRDKRNKEIAAKHDSNKTGIYEWFNDKRRHGIKKSSHT